MPRTLTRLRYRAPAKPPGNLVSTIDRAFTPQFPNETPEQASDRQQRRLLALERRVADFAARQSKPRQVRLSVVVSAKARLPATGQHSLPPRKPFTLKDVVDPAGTARHGQIIYIFRNSRTNQIIYSLTELLNDHHIDQLPFIGKHSKPTVLRPDEWTPHCVLSFPTPEQGHNAYRKLREFRKLHELAWEKTNPEWKHAPIKQRIKKIMDQRANTSADIAEVLRIQELHGAATRTAFDEQQQKVQQYMDKKWAEIDALPNATVAKEKEADNVKWLEHQIRSLTLKMKMKHNQNEADQKRLKNAKIIQEIRLRKIQYALRKAEQFKTMQESLALAAEPANEPDAESKLNTLQRQVAELRQSLADPDPFRNLAERAERLLPKHEAEIKRYEEAFKAKAQYEARDHHIARSVLPRHLKATLPTPYTLEGVNVRWADIQDALYAAGQWPEAIEHEVLDVNKMRNSAAWRSVEDFNIDVTNEASSIVQAIQERRGKSLVTAEA